MSDDRERQDRAAYLRGEPLTDDSARREVGWVARAARDLVDDLRHGRPADRPRYVELFARKARLLDYIGEPELAETARRDADDWREKGTGRPYDRPEPYVSPARAHAFEPGGRVVSIHGEVDPASVCCHCMLGRSAHEQRP